MSRFSLFPRVGEVNAWIEATVRAALQRDIAADYRRGVRGHGLRALQTRTSFPFQPFNMWLLAQRDRVATQSHRVDTRGEKLDEVDETKLCRTLDRNAFATNRDLAAVVGNKISERSVSVLSSSRKTTLHSKGCSRSGT